MKYHSTKSAVGLMYRIKILEMLEFTEQMFG